MHARQIGSRSIYMSEFFLCPGGMYWEGIYTAIYD